MVETVFVDFCEAFGAIAPHVVRFGNVVTTIQEDLNNLVIVSVGGEFDRSDVRGE